MFSYSMLGPLFFAALATSLGAQTWRQAAPATSPPPRATHAMATDLGTGRVLMFGGWTTAGYRNDTWEYDGTDWSAVAGPGPAERARHAMAFDEFRGRIVLFGGVNAASVNNYFGDTWEYANGGWQQRTTTTFPPVRFGHAMAFDRVRQRVVMFGGRTRSGAIFLNDTWEWDGTTWSLRTPVTAPTARMGHAMALDPSHGQVLLFGGIQIGGPIVGDTWTWNGTNWTQLSPAHPLSPRMNAIIATDLLRGRIVLYGGYNGVALFETAEWDGSDWTLLPTPVQPGVPAFPAMATGPGGRHVVLFGGEDPTGVPHAETWSYGQLAATRAFGSGCGAPPLALAPAAGSAPVLGQVFRSEMTAVPAGAVPFQSLGFSNTMLNGLPLPIDLTQFQMPGCFLHHDAVALFLSCTLLGGTATHALSLPNQPAFAGWEVYLQGYVLAPGSNPAGVLTSSALAVTLGF